MTTAKNFLKMYMGELHPEMDLRDGTVWNDILTANADFLDPVIAKMVQVQNNQSLTNYRTMPTNALDALMSNLGLERVTGTKSRGYVRIYFDTPVTTSAAPTLSSFSTTNGVVFEPYAIYTISAEVMNTQLEGGMYYWDIYTKCKTNGSNDISIGEVTTASGVNYAVSATNKSAFTGGSSGETAQQFYIRGIRALSTRCMASRTGALSILQAEFPELTSATFVGAGHELMTRDIIYNATTKENYITAQFNGGGKTVNTHKIYKLVSTEANPDMTNPSWTDVDDEVYEAVSAIENDSCTIQSSLIFDLDLETEGNTLGDSWYESDEGRLIGEELDPAECRVVHSGATEWLVLGGTSTSSAIWQGLIGDIIVRAGSQIVSSRQTIAALVDEAKKQVEETLSTNLSPIAQRLVGITADTGTKVVGIFKTTDTSARGRPSYVTLKRQASGYAYARDGIGFAWYKGDGSSYDNIFIIDNNSVAHDFNISNLRSTRGVNNYLASGKVEILINTEYNFELVVNESNAVQVRIWNTGLGVDTIISAGGVYTPQADGTHFGIGIERTLGSEWYYKDIKIYTINEVYTHLMFKFDLSGFGTDFTFLSRAFGVGSSSEVIAYGVSCSLWDGTQWVQRLTSSNSVMTDLITTGDLATYDVSGYLYAKLSTTNPAEISDQVARHVTNPGSLHVDYTALTADLVGVHFGGRADVYVHSTTVSEDEVVIVEAGKLVDMTTGDWKHPIIEGIKEYDAGGIASLEFKVELLDSYGAVQSTVDPDNYRLVDYDTNLRYSTKEKLKLWLDDSLVDENIKITYKYLPYTEYQTFLDNPSNREAAYDVLLKTYSPIFVDSVLVSGTPVTVTYRGSVEATTIKTAVENYLLDLSPGSELTITNITDTIQTAGATNVTPFTLQLYIYESSGAITESTLMNTYEADEQHIFFLRNVDFARE